MFLVTKMSPDRGIQANVTSVREVADPVETIKVLQKIIYVGDVLGNPVKKVGNIVYLTYFVVNNQACTKAQIDKKTANVAGLFIIDFEDNITRNKEETFDKKIDIDDMVIQSFLFNIYLLIIIVVIRFYLI